MIENIIIYYFIIISSLIIFRKILNLQHKKSKNILFIVYPLVIAALSALANLTYNGLDLCVIYILSYTFHLFTYRKSFEFTMLSTIISIAISIFLYVIAVIATIPIALILGNALSYNNVFLFISILIIGLLELSFSYLVFRIKPFKQGFPFLHEKNNSQISLFLSVGILFIFFFYRFGQIRSIHLLITIIVFICVIGIALYITNERQIAYHHFINTKDREISALLYELTLQNNRLINLSTQNDELGKLVHKDNKLIPSMELALQDVLTSYSPKKAKDMLEQLNTIFCERKGILTHYETNHITIANFESIRLNSIINYMHKSAIDSDISFHFSHIGDVSRLIDNIISEEDLCTLIADIVENAIIACKDVDERNLFLSIEATSNSYSFSVYDSGEPFSIDVIKRLGKKRYTTHKSTRGTGIGLMTTFEILQKLNASFTIDENPDYSPYTKYVSISFDNQFMHTYNGKAL